MSTTQTLSSVALDVVAEYHLAAKHLVHAYQAGVQRLAGAVNDRFAAVVQARDLPLVNEAVKSSLIEAQQHVAGLVAGGLRASSQGVASINDRLAEGVKGGIERLSNSAKRLDTAFDIKTTDTVALLGLPSAQLSLSVASAIAGGAKRLGERVDADEAGTVVEVVAKPKRAKRTTRRA